MSCTWEENTLKCLLFTGVLTVTGFVRVLYHGYFWYLKFQWWLAGDGRFFSDALFVCNIYRKPTTATSRLGPEAEYKLHLKYLFRCSLLNSTSGIEQRETFQIGRFCSILLDTNNFYPDKTKTTIYYHKCNWYFALLRFYRPAMR